MLSTAPGPGITGAFIGLAVALRTRTLRMAAWCVLACFGLAIAARAVWSREAVARGRGEADSQAADFFITDVDPARARSSSLYEAARVRQMQEKAMGKAVAITPLAPRGVMQSPGAFR